MWQSHEVTRSATLRLPLRQHGLAKLVGTAAALALISALLVPSPAQAKPHVDEGTTLALRSGHVEVDVARDFPRIAGYTWLRTGSHLDGALAGANTVEVNGLAYTPVVTASAKNSSVTYSLTIDELALTFSIEIVVKKDTVTFAVTDVDESGETKLETFGLPGLGLVSATADQPDATLSTMVLRKTNYDYKGNQDQHQVIASDPVDSAPQPANVAFISAGGLAAGVATNAITTYGPLQFQTTELAGVKRSAIWSNTWTYRGPDGQVVELPRAEIALSGERNGDGVVDWQDAAGPYRSIMPTPFGWEEVADNVVQYISMNFMSGVQQPFISALDGVKKGYLYTDGLGQSVQLKGYEAEGHDSAHGDFADHYNERAGGLADLKSITSAAADYNAEFGVHINSIGNLLESDVFRWDRQSSTDPGYFYGDAHWEIDRRTDLASGDYASRIAAMSEDLPDLGFVYSDVFFGEDWDAWASAKPINDAGLTMQSEFPSWLWPYVTWYHQSGEYEDVGIESNMMRFLYNSYADVWPKVDVPLLGGSSTRGIGGWHGERNVDDWIDSVFTVNLPTKYLQHFDVVRMAADTIDLEHGVVSALVDGRRQITQDGRLVADGEEFFIPWQDDRKGGAGMPAPDRVYAWSTTGAPRSWQVPATLPQSGEYRLYRLTDTGRTSIGAVTVQDGEVALDLEPGVPYVLYPTAAPVAAAVSFGEGAIVADGGFASRSFDEWQRSSGSGDLTGLAIDTDANGWPYLHMSGADSGRVSQQLNGLEPGEYAASVWVTTSGGREATLAVDVPGGDDVERSITTMPPTQDDGDHQLYGSTFQRIRVHFTVPDGGDAATLSLSAGASAGDAKFINVRVVRNSDGDPSNGDAFYQEDFEHVDQGWGPFVLDQPSEAGIHLSERNEDYTRDTIDGDWSLKAANGQAGQVYRTWPGTLDFESGHAYRVSLDYQADAAGMFEFTVGADGTPGTIASGKMIRTTSRALDSAPPPGESPDGWTDSLPPQGSAPDAPWQQTFVAGSCGDSYLALRQLTAGYQSAVIDNLVIEDLGPVAGAAGCTSLGTVVVEVPSLTPGSRADVAVEYTNTSGIAQHDVQLELDSSAGLDAEAVGDGSFAEVAAGASVSATFAVTVPTETPAESMWLTAKAAFTHDGERGGVTGAAQPIIAYEAIADAYDRVSITDDTAPAQGDFDGSGNSYSKQALEAVGIVPGGAVTVDQTRFIWPEAVGTPNSVTSAGQTIALTGSGGAIGFLASGGDAKLGTVAVTYADGSISQSEVAAPNWCCTAERAFGARTVATANYNNGPDGPKNIGTGYRISYVTAPIEQGKEVVSVTLPDNGMRVFDLAVAPLYEVAPAGDSFVSDLVWTSATSGWGPVERDHSLGEDLAGDGGAITLAGRVFDKGIGMAPLVGEPAAVRVELGGRCDIFHATVGLDDASATRGSVTFAVVGDGVALYESPVMEANSANQVIDVDLTGVTSLELRVGDGGNGIGNDHASWGDARLSCGEAAAAGTATDRRVDLTTAGDWHGVYGSAGWATADGARGDSVDGVTIDVSAAGPGYVWEASTDERRALQNADATGRVAAAWHLGAPRFTVTAPSDAPHRFGFYLLDWDSDNARAERLTLRDGVGRVLDTVEARDFTDGAWYSWVVTGSVSVTAEWLSGSNTVISGVFADPAARTSRVPVSWDGYTEPN